MRILKFPLEVRDRQSVLIPCAAKILSIQVQHGVPVIWALCDDSSVLSEHRYIDMYGTGEKIKGDPGDHIGTFQMEGGDLVFHAFEGRS